MIRFHQTFGAHTGRSLTFEKDVIRFGRLPDCEMPFDPQADLDASGRHAEVRREQGRWWIIDVGSRNGTLVNGQRITRAPLNGGEEIEFGPGGPRVRVEIAGAAPAGAGMAAVTPAPPPGWGAQPYGNPSPVPAAPRHDAATAAATPILTPPPPPMVPAVPMSGGRDFTGPMTPINQQIGGPVPVPAMPGPQGKVGQKTVAMMIEHALATARTTGQQGGSKSTAFLRAIATEAAQHSSRRLKIALTVVTVMLVLAVGALVVLVWQNRSETLTAREENVRLQQQLADLGNTDEATRRDLEARLAELNRQIESQQRGVGAHIAAANAHAIVLFVQRGTDGRESGLCSGFAVRADLLATNAHCVLAMERERMRGSVVDVLPNGGGIRLPILGMWRHPAYVENGEHPTADVGLVQIAGAAPAVVTMGTMDQLARLAPGQDVFVYGYPGNMTLAATPVATITGGVIGRLTSFDGRTTDVASSQLIQHSAFTSSGTSGSPIFDPQGVVIGINAGSFRSPQEQLVVDRQGPRAQMVLADSGYKYGVRADLLLGLLAGMGR